MSRRRYFHSTLVEICLLGEWQVDALVDRLDDAFYAYEPWTGWLARQMVNAFPRAPRAAQLLQWLQQSELLAQARQRGKARIRHYPLQGLQAKLTHPDLPALHTLADLAQWLHLSDTDLEWFADRAGRSAAHPIQKCRHYRICTLAKRSGGQRLLEAPKPTLKQLQRRIHHELLRFLDLHPAAFGFVAEGTPQAHAQLHIGQPVVLRFDLQDCFLHVHGGMVYRTFMALGYTDSVSRYLMALCTHRLPRKDLRGLELSDRQYQLAQQNHLPQGAPSSPLLSHFALQGVDRRLEGYARTLNACYSRYADDIVLSGATHMRHQFRQIQARIGSIVAEEGFTLNMRKSRCMTASQQQQVTGISVNHHLNMPRATYDRLKAELHNCVRNGWQSQKPDDCHDYRAHLQGRISWCEQLNAARGAKLRVLFDAIDWVELAIDSF